MPSGTCPLRSSRRCWCRALVCYLIEYFAANYFLNSGYSMQTASASAAPVGDMMIVVGNAILGPGMGKTFMLIEAFTVFLALIGTTLSCMNTGARVTYAMGKDDEVPEHFGMLHDKNLTPHRAIWTLAVISAVIGVISVSIAFGDAGAPQDAAIKALPQNIFSSFGYTTHDGMAKMPNTLLAVTLASNFGTFILYMLSCITCMVAFTPTCRVQLPEASHHSDVRLAGEPRLHGVLSDRPAHGLRNQDGAVAGPGDRAGLGHLRRHLLHALQQGEGAHDAGRSARDGNRRRNRLSYHSCGYRAGIPSPPAFFTPMLDVEVHASSPTPAARGTTTRIAWASPSPGRRNGRVPTVGCSRWPTASEGTTTARLRRETAIEPVCRSFAKAPPSEPLGALLARLAQEANVRSTRPAAEERRRQQHGNHPGGVRAAPRPRCGGARGRFPLLPDPRRP